ncbi:hypothetical protein K438DRAFT_1747424 [Mycena galopus ATCC 62051]|nr:hypothetical protein K438DRAFT_1747424 [Mycena galopus ATCC 62051]
MLSHGRGRRSVVGHKYIPRGILQNGVLKGSDGADVEGTKARRLSLILNQIDGRTELGPDVRFRDDPSSNQKVHIGYHNRKGIGFFESQSDCPAKVIWNNPPKGTPPSLAATPLRWDSPRYGLWGSPLSAAEILGSMWGTISVFLIDLYNHGPPVQAKGRCHCFYLRILENTMLGHMCSIDMFAQPPPPPPPKFRALI